MDATPTDADRDATGLPAEIRVDTWEHWLSIFNLVFAGFIILSVLLAALDTDLAWPAKLLSLLILAIPVAAYWSLARSWRFVPSDTTCQRSYAYLTIAVVAFFVLSTMSGAYFFLAFILFFQFWLLLPTVPAIVATALFSCGIWEATSIASGDGPLLRPTSLLLLAASIVVSAVLGGFIDAIIRQSRQRLELVRQLDAERHARTDAERRAGALEERGRLARDLHDTLAQGFTSIVLHLEAADGVVPRDAAGRDHLDQARRTARDSLGEVRRLVWALRPAELHEADLPDALRRMVGDWGRRHGLAATFRQDGDNRELPPDVEVSLLRIAQEALTNSERHAHATTVDVVLTLFDDAVNLDVRDDGQGFAPENAVANDGAGHGFGLIGIHDRVRALRGTVAIESRPGEGTTVAVSIPFAEVATRITTNGVEQDADGDGGPAGQSPGRLPGTIAARSGI